MSNLSIELKLTGKVRGDCTAPYTVELSRDCTLRELVDVILTRNEWGYIGQYDPRTVFGWPCIEYSGNLIKECDWREEFREEDYQRKVKTVKADGGWSRMDYIVTLE
jgi:hypothetical protein